MPASPLRASVVGVADRVSPTGELDVHGRALEAAVIKEALDDAGLTLADVDGVCHAESALDLAEFLGITPAFTDSTYVGGASYELYLEHAATALSLGLCEVVLIVYAATPRSDRRWGRPGWVDAAGPRDEWEVPFGLGLVGSYALAASRHMAEYGTTPEQLAEIAVSTRAWASLNPRARHRTPITVDDVLSSEVVASPLHVLDCCLVTDGAGAVVVTTPERARDLRKPPVAVLGAATAHSHNMVSAMPDLTVTPGVNSGRRAFTQAGICPADVDVLLAYDSFTITALLHLEDLGFCGKGEGGAFAAGGRLAPGGALPMNTNGGGLSYTHPGMYGVFLLVEAARQLRGECGDRQVSDARIAVAHGAGQYLSCMSTVVLGCST